ncbi:MAG: VOC family protein [Chloroflexota bacterium]
MTDDYTVGTVYLNVSNLDTMLAFYQENIGLRVHDQYDNQASLGAGADDLLVLTETPDRIHNPHATGLFHLAILVPDRAQLAKSFQHLVETKTRLQGLSEHLVSEAIYLADPDGNGIEIYRDRPREAWYKNGQFQLTTTRMDVDGVMSALDGQDATWQGLPKDTIMGHIHLHVSQIPQTEAFYHDVLGMDTMANMGSATFMSYDGYHHHLGANIWGGRQRRTGHELGLEKYDLHIPEQQLEVILVQAEKNNITITESNGAYTLLDPSNTQIILQISS